MYMYMIQRAVNDRKMGDDEGETNYVCTKKKVSLHVTDEHDSKVCNIESNPGPITHSQSRAVFHSNQ